MLRKLPYTICFFALLVFGVFQTYAQSISIISPVSNSTISGCAPYNIVWSGTGVNGVKVSYSLNGGISWITNNNYYGNTNFVGPAIPSYTQVSSVIIRVEDYYNANTRATVSGINVSPGNGFNNLEFTNGISSGSQLTCGFGSQFYLTWNSGFTSCVPFVNIFLSTNAGVSFPITVVSFLNNTNGSYFYNHNSIKQGVDNAVFKIVDSYNPNNFAVTSNIKLFSGASNAAPIAVTSPDALSTLSGCSSISMSYTGSVSDYFNFEYSINGGSTWVLGTSSVWGNNTSSFSFPTPSFTGVIQTRFVKQSSPFQTVTGSNYSIVNTVPKVKITQPSFNNKFSKISGLSIGWDVTSSCIPQLKLEYSINNGSSWTTIFQGSNSLYYNIPSSITSTLPSLSLLRLSDLNNPSNSNTQQLVLEDASLTVSTLVGNINFDCPAASSSISFSKFGLPNSYNFEIKYSLNGGASWQVVNSNYTNYNSNPMNFYWYNIPQAVYTSTGVLVKVTELSSGMSVSGSALLNFAEKLPVQSISVSSPSSQQPICRTYFKYGANFCSNIDVFLTTNAGVTLIPVTINANFSQFYYNFPASYVNGQSYAVVYRSSLNPSVSILGNSFQFTNGFRSINSFLSPQQAGSQNSFSLNFPQLCNVPNVNIDFSIDGGATFYNYASNQPNNLDGFFQYITPNTIVSGFRIKISDSVNPNVSVTSSSVNIVSVTGSAKTLSITSVTLNTLCGNSSSLTFVRNYNNSLYYSLVYSVDGGDNWKLLNEYFAFTSLLTVTSNFTIPFTNTNNLRLRVYERNSPMEGIATSGLFSYNNSVTSLITMSAPSNINSNTSNNVYFSANNSCVPYINIYVSTNNGVDFNKLYDKVLQYGYFQWNSYDFGVPQARYKIESWSNPEISVTSAAFSINYVAPSNITITSAPTGVSSCGLFDISFSNQPYTNQSFKVDMTTNDGGSWKTIQNANIGGYPTFTLTNLSVGELPLNTVFKIRISRTDNPLLSATTSGISITSVGVGSIAISNPVTGSVFASNSLTNISFLTTGAGCAIKDVKLEYSIDNGNSFRIINDNVNLVNSYSWYLPLGTNTNTALLRVSDINPNSVTVTSGVFSITNPTILVSVPGTVYQSTGVSIQAKTVGIAVAENYYGFYSLDGGNNWTYSNYAGYFSGTNNYNFNFTPPSVTSLTSAIYQVANNSTLVNATQKYVSNPFFISRPEVGFLPTLAGSNILSNNNITRTYNFTYVGWSGSTMYLFYTFDNGATATYLNSIYLGGTNSSTINWTSPLVGSVTGVRFVWGNSSNWASSTNRYIGNEFYLVPPLLSVTSPIQGSSIESNNSLQTNVAYTFSGWSFTTMYPYYSFDNGATATRITSHIATSLNGNGTNNFNWTSPTVTTITSTRLAWGNSTSWATSTIKFIGHDFNLIPAVTNTVSVTGSNTVFGQCQGRNLVLTFAGTGTINAGNKYIAEIVSTNSLGVGTGYKAGEISSTLNSGVMTITTPTVGYNGSWVLRVYSTAPQINNVNNLFYIPINFSTNACITANDNGFITTADGLGFLNIEASISYQINTTFNSGNQFIAQLSNTLGGFNSPLEIGRVTSTSAGLIPVTIPSGLPTSSNYQIRVVSTNLPTEGVPTGTFALNNAYLTVYSIQGNNFCPGKLFNTINIAEGDFYSGNQLKLELSSSSGVFNTNNFIGLINFEGTSYFEDDILIVATIPSSISTSSNYKLRLIATNPYSNTPNHLVSPQFTVYNTCINTLSFSAGPYFSGQSLQVRINPNVTFDEGNAYIAQLSNENGSFVNPLFIGSVSGTGLATISGIIPAIQTSSNNYYVRVISSKHPFTSSGYYLGTVSPLQITMSPSINASGFCQDAYVKLGDLTILGLPAVNNRYTVQMNDNGSTNFFSPFNVFSFNSSATGVVSIPGFYIPSSVLGNGFNRSFRVVSSNPSAISQNIIGTFGYNTKCFGSISLNTGIYMPNAMYNTSYSLYSGVAYNPGNQMIVEISGNDFATVLGIGSVTSTSSGIIPTSIPNSLPTGMYKVRVRATDFNSTSFSENIYVSQVNISPGYVDATKQYCQGGPIAIENFTVSSPVNSGNNYIVQLSTSNSFPQNATFGLTTIASSSIGSISLGNIIIPVNSLMGSNYYYYRIISTNPAAAVNYGSQFYISNSCLTNSNTTSSSYCPSATGSFYYGNVSFNSGNRITALLSDEFGNFNNALSIGSVLDNVAGGSKLFNFTIPSGLPQGTGYKIKLASNDFVSESKATNSFEIKQICIGQPGGYNTFVNQCSFIPLVTVASFGTVNNDNQYKLILTNSAGVPISNNSLLGTVVSNSTGVISFENAILPTIAGTYRMRVVSTSPEVLGDLTGSFSVVNNCLAAPYFPSSKICSGNQNTASVYVSSGNTYNSGNQFIIELSNSAGNFSSPITVYSVNSQSNNFYATVTIPSGMPTGTNYRLRVRSTNPVFMSNDGNSFAIDQICLTAGTIDFGPYIGGSSNITIPINTIGTVSGGNIFSASLYSLYGSYIGEIGTSSTNTITGLLPSVLNGGYYFAVITSSSPIARSTNSNLFIVNPTDMKVAPLVGSYCVGSSISGVVFTVSGTVSGGNVYSVDLSDANGYFYYTYNNVGILNDATNGVKTISAYIPLGIVSSPNYKIRLRASNGSISNEIPIDIKATFEWTGNVNKDWNNIGNWSCPLIPTSNIDVVIPEIGNQNYPEINVTNAVARNFTVNTLASAFILDNGLLSVYGNFIINGTFNSNTLGGLYFSGAFNSSHDILGSGTINLGLVTVPSFNYLNIRNQVSKLYRYYNYGSTYNYSVVNNIYEFYNYSRFEAYNNFTVINRFQNDYIFNVYNTYFSNPSFYIGNYFVNNSSYFNTGVSNFYFNGSNSVISGTYVPTFYNFYVNSGTNLSLSNIGINVYANYGNDGLFNGLGHPISFISSPYNIPTVISGNGVSNFGSVIFNNSYGVNVTNNISVQNDFINVAGFNAGSSVISFTGNGIQNISSSGIGNLTFNGINVAETTSDLGVDASLVVKGSFANRGRFRNRNVTIFEGNSPQVISGGGNTIFQNFYNYNSSSLSILTNIVVEGNIENNGSLNSVGYTISTTGITPQTISGANVISLGSIDNSNSSGLEINQDVVIQGSFTNRGRVRNRNNSLVLAGDATQTVSSTSETIFNTIVVNNTVASVNLEGTFSINGNIENNGQLDATNSAITLSGISNQTISGQNVVALGTVVNENKASIVEVTQDLSLAGSFTNRGRVRNANNRTILSGNTTQTISGSGVTEFKDLISLNTVSSVVIVNNLNVSGNIETNGTIDASNSTITFGGGDLMQTISGSNLLTLGSLVNNNTLAGLVVESPTIVKGDIVNNGGLEVQSNLTFGGANTQISGTTDAIVTNVEIAPSGSFTNNRALRVRGNVVNNSSTTAIGATSQPIVLEGTSVQTISGSSESTFNQLSINNNVGVLVEKSMSTSNISLSGANVKVKQDEQLIIISTSPGAIVVNNTSYVEGTLQRAIAQTGVGYNFPVGNDDAFRGTTITFTGSTNTNLSVTSSKTQPVNLNPNANNGAPLVVFEPSLNDTLKAILPGSIIIKNASPTTTGVYDIEITVPVTLPGYTNPSQLVVVKRENETTPWQAIGAPTPTTVTTVSGRPAVRASRRGLSSFSEFAVAGTCSNVSRVTTKPAVELVTGKYASSIEGNNYEWSIDDVVQRALTTKEITPNKPGAYRVRVIQSGCYSDASDPITFVSTEQAFGNGQVSIYPNPSTGTFTVEISNAKEGQHKIEIFDMIGSVVDIKAVSALANGTITQTFDLSTFTKGIYFVKVSRKDTSKVFKVIVE